MLRHSHQVTAACAAQLQWIATVVVALAAIAALGACAAAAAGLLPWLDLPLSFGGESIAWTGMAVQVGVALLLITVALSLPAGTRVLRLEKSHRDFSICMSDVAQAYSACHAADRAGAFTLSGEFDAVRERIRFLRAHPDLGNLEPGVLEAAAQMSQVSRELAETYSEEAVERARGFLRQRQEEIEAFRDRIGRATEQCHELRRWLEQVELEECVMESQLGQLEEQLGDTLEKLGFSRRRQANVVPLATAAE